MDDTLRSDVKATTKSLNLDINTVADAKTMVAWVAIQIID